MATFSETISRDAVRVAATADLHFGRYPPQRYVDMFRQISQVAHVLLICGDLTDHGERAEARGLARAFEKDVTIPVVAVLGNHDCEGGGAHDVSAIFRDAGVVMLDGDTYEFRNIGFAGVKGFCGGFGRRALEGSGESVTKQYVREAVSESLKLDAALAQLRSPARVALLHYAPLAATVAGEPLELFPFLGSSRLEAPLARHDVAGAFHGHAHHGRRFGRLSNGAPVFNVSFPLRQRTQPDQPFQIVAFHAGAAGAAGAIDEHDVERASEQSRIA